MVRIIWLSNYHETIGNEVGNIQTNSITFHSFDDPMPFGAL